MNNITLNVEGMSCMHCENRVKNAVGSLGGVESVQVNLAEKTVTVAFDAATLTQEQIKETIEEQGYDVK